MGILNIFYTVEYSVLTEGEVSFTLYANKNMADTRIMYCYFKRHTTLHHGLVLRVSDFGTTGPGSIPRWALITNCLFFFFSLVMQMTSYKKYGVI